MGGYWFSVAASAQFSLNPSDDWPEVELPTEEILAVLNRPNDDESEQEWADIAEARGRWVYEQVMAGVKYERIIREMKGKPTKWQRVSSIAGIKAVARTYANRHSLPEPDPRQPGRPAGR